jgi:hypothetical protein
MSQWNTLSVPLETGWQCTLVLTSEYRNSSGELFVFIQGKELKQLEQDRQDFDRYFRPRGDLRTVSGRAQLHTIQSFLSDSLNTVHWNLPDNNAGAQRMLREAVADGRLVPVINRDWRSSGLVSRPTPTPLRWPSSSSGFGGGGQKWAAFDGGGSGPLSFNGEPILSGPYDPATQESRLSVARGEMAASGSGGLLGVVGAVARAALGSDFDADDASGEVPDDSGDTSTPLGDAQSFEYTEDAVGGDTEELAASTNNPRYAAKMLGYDQNTFSDMLHQFKPRNGLGPADNVLFNDDGSVEFNGKILDDNIHDYAP